MNKDKSFAFVKRWNALEARARELDFDRSQLVHEIRDEFENGAGGDRAFKKWCDVELGLSDAQSDGLLLRARAFAIVGDRKAWDKIGGFRAISAVTGLPPIKQVHVLESAKATGRSVLAILRQHAKPNSADVDELTLRQEIALLAAFVLKLEVALPASIEKIAKRYRRQRKVA